MSIKQVSEAEQLLATALRNTTDVLKQVTAERDALRADADKWSDLLAAAVGVLSWTDQANRPPVRDKFECGRSASVRVHALADMHEAITAIQEQLK